MNTRRDTRTGRLRGQRGATLLEFAFVFPVFMTLVLGMFNFGQAYNRKIGMTAATAEASRYAATLDPTSLPFGGTAGAAPGSTHGLETWLWMIANAVQKDANGALDTGVDGLRICVAYVHPSATNPAQRDDYGHWLIRTTSDMPQPDGPTVRCFADGLQPGDRRVQIEVTRLSPVNALLYTYSGLTLTSRSVSRFEATSP